MFPADSSFTVKTRPGSLLKHAMTRLSVLVLVLVLVLVSLGSEARVRLSSIRTVVIPEDEVLALNRSSWEPTMDQMLFQCKSDLECSEGNFCHASTRGPAHSRCQACRRRKKRCHRDTMCCPGNSCSNNICVPIIDSFTSQRFPDSDGGLKSTNKRWRKRGGTKVGGASGKGQVGDPCIRSSDCSDSSCCARHFWTRICKPVLREGQVCTQHRHKGTHGLELFQRCSCGDGLTCRTLRGSDSQPPSSSSSSLLMAAAAKSKFSSSRRSSNQTSSSSSAKTRLHVCQKKIK
uniref:Dickkopf-related protein 2-like n=2 Tax=Acanthochromis polyacanthus TaxID=80966 RepID=A0A3Q1GHA2_9TELE